MFGITFHIVKKELHSLHGAREEEAGNKLVRKLIFCSEAQANQAMSGCIVGWAE